MKGCSWKVEKAEGVASELQQNVLQVIKKLSSPKDMAQALNTDARTRHPYYRWQVIVGTSFRVCVAHEHGHCLWLRKQHTHANQQALLFFVPAGKSSMYNTNK